MDYKIPTFSTRDPQISKTLAIFSNRWPSYCIFTCRNDWRMFPMQLTTITGGAGRTAISRWHIIIVITVLLINT
jgi:hypothetical protein